MAAVRQLAMGFSLVDQYLHGACPAFDYPGFWSHSLFMAVASQELGRMVRTVSPEELFACGLLAQIGCLALATVYPAEYADVLGEKMTGVALLELERKRLMIDHTEFTAAILADCRIPKALAEPVCWHEEPEASGFVEGSRPYQLVHLLFQARRMADLGLSPAAERHHGVSELMLLGGKNGLDAIALGEVFDRVVHQWHEGAALLKSPDIRLPSFDAIVNAPVPHQDHEAQLPCSSVVLLVEDEPTSRIMTEGYLRHLLGCTVYTAENGKEALALALEVMPQIVIADWLMPVMDGFELCRALRATDWGQSMYIIMLTGEGADEAIVEAFEAGVDDYVTKPVNARALSARMRAALHYVNLLKAWERDRAQLKQFTAELAISNQRFEHAAMTDLLLGTAQPSGGHGCAHEILEFRSTDGASHGGADDRYRFLQVHQRSAWSRGRRSGVAGGGQGHRGCSTQGRQRQPDRRRGVHAALPRCGRARRPAGCRASAQDGQVIEDRHRRCGHPDLGEHRCGQPRERHE